MASSQDLERVLFDGRPQRGTSFAWQAHDDKGAAPLGRDGYPMESPEWEVRVPADIGRFEGIHTADEYIDRVCNDIAPPAPPFERRVPSLLSVPIVVSFLDASGRHTFEPISAPSSQLEAATALFIELGLRLHGDGVGRGRFGGHGGGARGRPGGDRDGGDPGQPRTAGADKVSLPVGPDRRPARAGEHPSICHVTFAVGDVDAVARGPEGSSSSGGADRLIAVGR
jgi:hypothetical protein